MAYDLGFVDGGGDVADPFDAARRANLAALRRDNVPRPAILAVQARPLPSQWPKPADAARPASWSRRLALIGDAGLLDRVLGHADAQAITVVAIGADIRSAFRPAPPPFESVVSLAKPRRLVVGEKREGGR